MNADLYSRPSAYARWGWVWAAVTFFGGLMNIIRTFDDPSWWRLLLCALTLAVTTYCLVMWRRMVRQDAEHRAYMRASYERWAR